MKVIHVTWNAERYGIGTFLISLLSYQKNNFEDLEMAIAFHADGPRIGEYRNLGVPVYSLGRKTAKDVRLFFQFYKIFKDYDIVNLHSSSPWAFLAGKMAGKKIVYTFHGALGLKKQWIDILIKKYYRFILNRYCDMITFASKSSLSRYLAGVGYRPKSKQIELFPYGIQINSITTQNSREGMREDLQVKGKFVVGTVARMDPMKRIDRVIEAFVSLPKKNDFQLLIIGSGDMAYQDYLSRQVMSYQLQDQVLFLGYRSDVLDIVNSLDLFVLPSSNEPFGLALLEAMALGIPSAVFKDGGGAVDILGESGFIVRNPKELSDVILNLKEDTLLRESVARKAKERAQLFDIKHTAENLYRIYTSLS